MVALAMLEDISVSGASMRIRHAIDVGARLEIEWQRQNFTGVVRFCRPDGIEFILGILKDAVPATEAQEQAP
jgi:hypothetical protein